MRGHSDELLPDHRQGEALVSEAPEAVRSVFIESYGCQMNFSDSEIVAGILAKEGYGTTRDLEKADLVLLNTCSIRDKAEQTIRNRLKHFQSIKAHKPHMVVGLLGCMAERLKHDLLEQEKLVDLVVGPDAYRELPHLLEEIGGGRKAVNVLLSKEETYGDLNPVRLGSNGVTAFVSITRGCDNMCSFCVVPFTRGRERSRNPQTILDEVRSLRDQGYREVTLLGQNVDSYLWYGGGPKKDFAKASAMAQASAVGFASLLRQVAEAVPEMRIRFSTSNPQDMHDDVLYAIAKYPNLCKSIHLPVQSGSSRILKAMNRGHDREDYLARIERIRRILPEVALSMDMIAGFPGETEEDHAETLSLMEAVRYHFGFMFYYSERPGTHAARTLVDDIPLEVKKRRLNEIIELQQRHSLERNQAEVGRVVEVLIEGDSKRSEHHWTSRTTQNTVVVFPKLPGQKPGDLVWVAIEDCSAATLLGQTAARS
ncbi:tRNA (N6-isopentenyl adenosine(37)-C2)-methylthiotransferase MiaB [bacterium]|nr:tRNA (N6-isopentenyl adenosine(37)-C2)-methylthiotransferase MiaB [bacterium]